MEEIKLPVEIENALLKLKARLPSGYGDICVPEDKLMEAFDENITYAFWIGVKYSSKYR